MRRIYSPFESIWLQDTFVFGRFPVDKTKFVELMWYLAKKDEKIAQYLQVYADCLDKTYFTMTRRELGGVLRRRGVPDGVEGFYGNGPDDFDATYSYLGRCIILHAPSMGVKLKTFTLRDDDPEGKLLFTLHFFSVLFHELGHAHDVGNHLARHFATGEAQEEFDEEHSEEVADVVSKGLMARMQMVLEPRNVSMHVVADHLWDWDRLGPVVMGERGHKRPG